MKTAARRVLGGRPSGWTIEVTRSAIAALVCAVVDYGILIPLVELVGVAVVTASAIGVAAGQVTSYLLHTIWIFPSGDHGYHKSQLFAYLAIGAVSLLTHTGAMYLLATVGGVHYLPAKVISVLLMFSLGFLLRRFAHRYLRRRG